MSNEKKRGHINENQIFHKFSRILIEISDEKYIQQLKLAYIIKYFVYYVHNR